MQDNQLINKHYDDCYFSDSNGYLESEYVFIDGNNLKNRILNNINIGETGFGTGLNLLVLEDTIEAQFKENKIGPLDISFTTVEKFPLHIDNIEPALSRLPEVSKSSLERHLNLYKAAFNKLTPGWNSFEFTRKWGCLKINIYYGDVLDSFINYPVKNNCWFLDGHSPDKNPDMWSQKVFNKISLNTALNGTFATFTSAGIVKRGLREAEFHVQRKKGFGKKRHMIFGMLIS